MIAYATTIAIDGPAASGKSTLGARLADKLLYTFVDAGVLYRAITHEALSHKLDIHDEVAMVRVARHLRVEIDPQRRGILLQGQSADLHSTAVNKAVAVISAYADVRESVRRIQREIAQSRAVVFAGRDIGTVVLPNADLKLFLQASLDERVERRYASLTQAGTNITREQLREDLRKRDDMDSHRSESPMRAADDAIIIDTDGMSIDEVLAVMLHHAACAPAPCG